MVLSRWSNVNNEAGLPIEIDEGIITKNGYSQLVFFSRPDYSPGNLWKYYFVGAGSFGFMVSSGVI